MESYNILGLSPDATDSEVRKTYLKLAVKQHPDKGGDEGKFQEITEAYHKILEERMGAKERERTMKEIFEETFREVNEAFKKSEQRNKKSKEPGVTKPVNRKLRLPLKDMWNGCSRKVTTRFRASCADCDGYGRLGRVRCDVCDGTGNKNYRVRLSGGLVVANKVECKECHGRGEKPDVSKGICSVCRGTGKYGRQMPLTVRIPPLSKPGDTILLKNGAVGVPSVGMLFTLYPDIPVGARSVEIGGLDIVVNKLVGLKEAICGFEWDWEHPGGDFTTIRLRPVKPGEEIRVKGKGWEDGDGNRGDLVFRFELEWPGKTEQGFREEFQVLWDKQFKE